MVLPILTNICFVWWRTPWNTVHIWTGTLSWTALKTSHKYFTKKLDYYKWTLFSFGVTSLLLSWSVIFDSYIILLYLSRVCRAVELTIKQTKASCFEKKLTHLKNLLQGPTELRELRAWFSITFRDYNYINLRELRAWFSITFRDYKYINTNILLNPYMYIHFCPQPTIHILHIYACMYVCPYVSFVAFINVSN